MRYVKWTFWLMLVLLVGGFLHYTLPQHDIVRIVGTENRRVDIGGNSIFWARSEAGMVNSTSRDVFFINAVDARGRPHEYRNEDTGWGWPPYFKLDSSNLQAESQALISTDKANPTWVSVTHYGWRNEFFTIYPNAVSVKQVAGPDVRIIPWFNILFFIVLAGILIMLWRMWAQFRERTIDPTLESIGDRFDEVDARAEGLWARFKAWLATWTGKPRR